jgi:hypothetical protein
VVYILPALFAVIAVGMFVARAAWYLEAPDAGEVETFEQTLQAVRPIPDDVRTRLAQPERISRGEMLGLQERLHEAWLRQHRR